MRRCTVWCVAMFICGLVAIPETAASQVEILSRAVRINLTGRAHVQFNHTSADAVLPTTFLVRRARLTAEVTVNDFVYGKLQPDYGEGVVGLRDAFVRLNFSPAFRTTAGQFKRPFDVFELVSSTQILVIERTGSVRGITGCAGVGDVCTLSRFTEKLSYSDRDIGFMVDGRVSNWRYFGSITNGGGLNQKIDENGSKSFTGRLEYGFAGRNGTIGIHAGAHDYVFTNPVDSTTRDAFGYAYGADVDWGEYETPGWHIKAGVAYGDNWKNQVGTTSPNASKFLTAQGIVSYYVPIRDSRVVSGVEPLGRVSWGDPDRDAASDDGVLLTPGVMVFFTGRNKFAVNFDYYKPAGLDAEYSVKAQLYFHF